VHYHLEFSSYIPFSRSREWVCPHCQQTNLQMLPDPSSECHSPASLSMVTDVASSLEANFLHERSPSTRSPSETSELTLSEPDVTIHTVHPSCPPTRTHSTMSLDSLAIREESPPVFHTVHAAPLHRAPFTNSTRSRRPPLLLDTAICVLLVLTLALVCRRLF
jgi:ubiquitin-conjugating enzyme E2 J1